MTLHTKLWLIIAICLILLGSILFVGALAAAKWDFAKLSSKKYVTNSHVISDAFHSLSLHADTGNILLLPSPDGRCVVECYEEEKVLHNVSVEDGTLNLQVDDQRAWYDYIGFFFSTPKIKVYLPAGSYETLRVTGETGDIQVEQAFTFSDIDLSFTTGSIHCHASASNVVKLKTSTGSIQAENISAGSMELSVTTGKITLSGITCAEDLAISTSTGKVRINDVICQNLNTRGDTGDLTLEHVTVNHRLVAERSTGDIQLDRCDAGELFIRTDTGDISGTLLSPKVFLAQSDTGRVRVPKTGSGGRCELTTDTGSITMDVVGVY